MDLFRKSGYFDESSNEHSFMNRLSGMAKMAGIIGVGIATAPYWSRLAGRMGSAIAERFPGRLSSNTIESAIKDVFGEEAQSFYNFPEQLQKQIATAITRTRKIDRFLGEIAQHVDVSKSTASFANAKDGLVQFLSAVGKVGDLSENEVEKVILNPDSMRYFTREAHKRGIVFQEAFHQNQRQIFERITAETAKAVEPNRTEIMQYMHDPANRATVLDAFKHLHEHQQRSVNFSRRFANFDHMDEITFGHLQDTKENQGTRLRVEKYLDKIGVVARDKDGRIVQEPGAHSTFRVDEILEKAKILREDPKKGLFVVEGPQGFKATLEATEFAELMKKTTTGLAVDRKSGDVISIAMLRHQRKAALNTFMDEFQIPLVPFKFNVPLRMFRFMRPSEEPIKALGSLANEPELRRMGYLANAHMQGMGIGEKLLTIDPVSKKLDFINETGKRFISFRKRDSSHVAKLLDSRSQDIEHYLGNLTNFRGAEDNYSEKVLQRYFNYQHKLVDINYHPAAGFVVTNKETTAGRLMSPLISKVFGNGTGVDINKLHPTQLADFIMNMDGHSFANMNPEHLKQAMGHIIREAKQARVDISGFLKGMGGKISDGTIPFDKSIPYYAHLTQMLKNADDPRELMRLLGQSEIREATGGISSISPGTLYKNASSTFYMAVNTLKNDMGSLLDVTQGEAGFVNSWKSGIFGQTGVSQSYEKLQEGLLAEVVRGVGVGHLDQAASRGGKITTAGAELIEIRKILDRGIIDSTDTDFIKGTGISDHLKDLGFLDNQGGIRTKELRSFVNEIINSKADGTYSVNREALGKFGAAVVDKKGLFNETTDGITKAKIMDDVRSSMNDFEVFRDANSVLFHKQASVLYQMAADADIVDILRKRFTLGRPFHPEAPHLSPTNINNFFTTTSDAPSIHDWFDSPVASLNSQIRRLFGAPEFISSIANPKAALGPIAMGTQSLLQMPQEIANLVGLGLTGQDRITTLRSSLSFYGKRILPLVVGFEAYKNYNANMHAIGMYGLDDMAANIIANISIDMSKAKDALGITTMNQYFVNTLPGLDQYFTPRSEKEYREYLMYGDEEVREGRGWMIGSRTPLLGGRIKYDRPNFFRRWRSHWTEADNVDIANPQYSFLPNLQHPLAPLNLILNPHWWEKKHRDDRPYIPGGNGVGNPEASRNPQDTFLTINSMGNYGPMAIGEFGAGYPASMSGGGQPMYLDPHIRRPRGVILDHGDTGMPVAGSVTGTGRNGQPLYSSGFLGPGGDKISLGLHKGIEDEDLTHFSPISMLKNYVQAARSQAGLYGAIMQRLPFFPEGDDAFQRQDASNARSFGRSFWMGEYGEATGPFGEFVRRFVQNNNQGFDAYNPLPNNMPAWLPDRFKTGDPYMRTPGIGELQLPGDAYERTHPWVAPLRVRGSTIGYSEEELIQKWINPVDPITDEDALDIVDFGSEVHKRVQRQLYNAGLLIGAEVSIYDKEHNLSGTLDAVIKSEKGLEVVDFKTQGARGFEKGEVPDKYKDQLTFYMATTGIHNSQLIFIEREDPEKLRFVDVPWDPERWQRIIDKVERARSTMHKLVDEGAISPFESYDLVSRIEILSKVAPESAEFKKHVEFALQGGLGGFEKQRVEEAVKEAQKLRQEYNLYPLRYGVDTETRSLRVEDVNSDGTILTEMGNISLAGVKFDQQAFAYRDPVDVMAEYGINVGKRIPVTLIKGQFNGEVMNDVTLPAIVDNVNRRIIGTQYAEADKESRNPLASEVVYGQPLIGRAWEWLAHTDNMITNKFLRVRTALEQFERGEVFGTDRSKWDDPINNFVKPTIASFIKKDPITAGLQSGIVASLFFRTNKDTAKLSNMKGKAFKYAAIAGATISLLRGVYERMTGTTWTPGSYKKQAQFDEYWDILEYMKFTSIAERAKDKARSEEGVDIDRLREAPDRQTAGLGPWAVLAIDADRKAKRTMYGFEESTGSLQDALSAIPRRQQQIAEDIVMSGSLDEKQRFYDLLPTPQRRVLGKFLNIEDQDLPDRPNLTSYFGNHFLPDVDWGGWQRTTDMDDLRTRAAEHEHMNVEKPNRAKVSKARAYTKDVSVPRMDNPTSGNIRKQIRALLESGFNDIDVRFDMRPSDASVVNVDMNLFEDHTKHLLNEMREDIRRG